MLAVPAGSSRAFGVSLETGDGEFGEVSSVSTFVDCVDNEALVNTRSALVTRAYADDPGILCLMP